MITVSELNEVKIKLKDIFPDAVRGSESKSKWGRGRKQLHLSYWIGSDTVGGLMIIAKKDLFYFAEWDTNYGVEYRFAESTIKDIVLRVRAMFYDEVHKIERTVTM